MVMSRRPACPVSSFSLLSSSTFALDDVNAMPRFEPGDATQPCTSEVTSKLTYCPALVTLKLPTVAPMVGNVA